MYPPIVVGSEDLREEDLSHPVHSDNCMIQDDGSCIADDLAYSQRHYRYDTPTTQHSFLSPTDSQSDQSFSWTHS